MVAIFSDSIFKCLFLNEKDSVLIKIKFCSLGFNGDKSVHVLVSLKAGRWTGN